MGFYITWNVTQTEVIGIWEFTIVIQSFEPVKSGKAHLTLVTVGWSFERLTRRWAYEYSIVLLHSIHLIVRVLRKVCWIPLLTWYHVPCGTIGIEQGSVIGRGSKCWGVSSRWNWNVSSTFLTGYSDNLSSLPGSYGRTVHDAGYPPATRQCAISTYCWWWWPSGMGSTRFCMNCRKQEILILLHELIL